MEARVLRHHPAEAARAEGAPEVTVPVVMPIRSPVAPEVQAQYREAPGLPGFRRMAMASRLPSSRRAEVERDKAVQLHNDPEAPVSEAKLWYRIHVLPTHWMLFLQAVLFVIHPSQQ